MVLTKSDQRKLADIKGLMDKELKEKWLKGLAKTFDLFGYKAVAREIKAGRNVRGNVLYGVNMAHDRFGPRYDLENKKFIPQSKSMREKEHRFVFLVNKGLEGCQLAPIDTKELFAKFRAKDKAFEERVKNR